MKKAAALVHCNCFCSLLTPVHRDYYLFEDGCFLRLGLVFVLLLSVNSTTHLGSWVASVLSVSGDSEGDFQENPEEGRAHVRSPSLWGLSGGKLCDLLGSHFSLRALVSNFYTQMGLLKPTTLSELPSLRDLCISSCLGKAVLGRVDTAKNSSFSQAELL
uniref:Uncharacterized protein n=1 Tax=Pipistrellus kuhlii TaxID=59472 RepID=A0A7J7W3F9_PIPKU|nr:hypothetical protein mPipKuh1_008133 [Pipistrellus kuhlii]